MQCICALNLNCVHSDIWQELKSASDAISELESALVQASVTRQQNESTIAALSAMTEQLSNLQDSNSQTISHLSATLTDNEAALTAKASECNTLQQQLMLFEHQRSELKSALEQKSSAERKLQVDLSQAQCELRYVSETVQRLRARITVQQQLQQTVNSALQSCEDTLTSKLQQLQEVQSQLQAATTAHSAASTELSTTQESLQQSQVINSILRLSCS